MNTRQLARVARRIQAVLSPDLLSRDYRHCADEHPQAGHCYAATEAAFHCLGGAEAGWAPYVARDEEGGTHWWLRHRSGLIFDVTKAQFTALGQQPPYAAGKGKGFLTARPSKRARLIIERAGLSCATLH